MKHVGLGLQVGDDDKDRVSGQLMSTQQLSNASIHRHRVMDNVGQFQLNDHTGLSSIARF